MPAAEYFCPFLPGLSYLQSGGDHGTPPAPSRGGYETGMRRAHKTHSRALGLTSQPRRVGGPCCVYKPQGPRPFLLLTEAPTLVHRARSGQGPLHPAVSRLVCPPPLGPGGSPCVPSGARGTGPRGSGQIQSCFLRIHCAAPVPWLHLPAGEAGKRRLYSGPAFPLLKTGGYYYTEEAKADAGGPRRLPTPCSPYRYLCFTDNDPEAQRDEVSCSKAHSFFKLPSLPPGRHPL